MSAPRMMDPEKLRDKDITEHPGEPPEGCPCDGCPDREFLARAFDIHVYGSDCPYACREYDEWKARRGREE